jgi:hypothetical protein
MIFLGISLKNEFLKLFPLKIPISPNIFGGKFSTEFSSEISAKKMYKKAAPVCTYTAPVGKKCKIAYMCTDLKLEWNSLFSSVSSACEFCTDAVHPKITQCNGRLTRNTKFCRMTRILVDGKN